MISFPKKQWKVFHQPGNALKPALSCVDSMLDHPHVLVCCLFSPFNTLQGRWRKALHLIKMFSIISYDPKIGSFEKLPLSRRRRTYEDHPRHMELRKAVSRCVFVCLCVCSRTPRDLAPPKMIGSKKIIQLDPVEVKG